MKKLLLLLPAAFALAGCMSLPSASAGQSILVLPYKFVDKATGLGEYTLRFTYRSLTDDFENSFAVSPSTAGYDVKVMKPGEYTITRLQLVETSTGAAVHDFTARLDFSCEAGLITIAKSKYRMEFERDATYGYVKAVSLAQEPVTKAERESIAVKVRALAGGEGWEVAE